MTRPGLSLCMIVRDEAALLPGCLASVKGVVDEMVVVDTGSRDGTRELAQSAGARVFDFAWVDDFAAARNHGLARARGRWVLVLDADERLTPGAAHVLRAAVERAPYDCGLLRLHEAASLTAAVEDVLSGAARLSEPQRVPRLLRREDGLAYRERVHENVLAWLARRGNRVAHVDADIIHLGATPELVQAKSKVARNVRMLTARIDADPRDVEAYGYLAHEYLRTGRYDEARSVCERGWQSLGPDADGRLVHRLTTARALLLREARAYPEARQTLAQALLLEGENPDLVFLSANVAEAEAIDAEGERRDALLEEAALGYRRCLELASREFPLRFVPGASSWSGGTRLGTVLLQLGRAAEARDAFTAALALRPAERAPALGCVEARIASGDATGALTQLDVLLDGGPDAWTLAGLAAEALGHGGDARLFALRARDSARRGFVAPHRRRLLARLIDRIAA